MKKILKISVSIKEEKNKQMYIKKIHRSRKNVYMIYFLYLKNNLINFH